MVQLSVTIEGDKALIRKYNKLKGQLTDFSKEMRYLSKWFEKFFSQDVFATEGDVLGEQWPRLGSKYEYWKRIRYAGRGILERSGKLRRGYTSKSGKDYAAIRNTVAYAIYHQEGTSKMPQRLLVKIDKERREFIIGVFRDAVIQRLQKTFR